MVVLGLLAAWDSSAEAFSVSPSGYVVAGEGRSKLHGGAILVALLMFGGAIPGLIVGAVNPPYRVGQRMTVTRFEANVARGSRACVTCTVICSIVECEMLP